MNDVSLFIPQRSHRGTVLQMTCHLQAHIDLIYNPWEKLNSTGPQTLSGVNNIRQRDAEGRLLDTYRGFSFQGRVD